MKKENKIKKYVLNHWVKICAIIGIVCYLSYVMYMYIEVPFETYMSKLCFVEPFYNKTLTFSSLFTTYGEHGMLGVNLLFLLNLKFFHFSVLFESLINALLVLLVGAISLNYYSKLIPEEKRGIIYYLALTLMTYDLFSCLQQGGGAMTLQVRFSLASFVCITCMIDKIILNEEKEDVLFFLFTLAMIFASINIFGTFYSFAGTPVLIVILLYTCIKKKNGRRVKISICTFYFLCVVLYFVEYGMFQGGNDKIVATSSISDVIIQFFLNIKSVFESLLFWFGMSVLGTTILEDGHISTNLYLAFSFGVFLFFVVSIILFFKMKIYKKTFLPIFWYGYYFMLFFMIYLGRGSGIGSLMFPGSWYIAHSKIMIVSLVFVYLYAFYENKKKQNVNQGMVILCFVFLLMSITIGTISCIRRLPSERIWIKDKQAYFFVESIDELPVGEDGMTPLFQSREVSWEGIQILKKYKLSLFREYDAYEIMQYKRENGIN